jgi:hypothetical protein
MISIVKYQPIDTDYIYYYMYASRDCDNARKIYLCDGNKRTLVSQKYFLYKAILRHGLFRLKRINHYINRAK